MAAMLKKIRLIVLSVLFVFTFSVTAFSSDEYVKPIYMIMPTLLEFSPNGMDNYKHKLRMDVSLTATEKVLYSFEITVAGDEDSSRWLDPCFAISGDFLLVSYYQPFTSRDDDNNIFELHNIKNEKKILTQQYGRSTTELKFSDDSKFLIARMFLKSEGWCTIAFDTTALLSQHKFVVIKKHVTLNQDIDVFLESEFPFSSQEYSNAFASSYALCVTSKDLIQCANFLNEFGIRPIDYYPERLKRVQEVEEWIAERLLDNYATFVRRRDAEGLMFLAHAYITPRSLRKRAFDSALQIYDENPAITDYLTITDSPKSGIKNKIVALEKIYSLVQSQKNIAGYKWFLERFPSSPVANKALTTLHQLAFAQAKSINTIEAYNDFIVTYSASIEMPEADMLAYGLEKQKYANLPTTNEKLARSIGVKAMQIRRQAEATGNDAYLLIVARMTRLLQNEFGSTAATQAHLGQAEIQNALKGIPEQLEKVKKDTATIAGNTTNLSKLIKEQTQVMDAHFVTAAQNHALAEKYTAERRLWERYLKNKK